MSLYKRVTAALAILLALAAAVYFVFAPGSGMTETEKAQISELLSIAGVEEVDLQALIKYDAHYAYPISGSEGILISLGDKPGAMFVRLTSLVDGEKQIAKYQDLIFTEDEKKLAIIICQSYGSGNRRFFGEHERMSENDADYLVYKTDETIYVSTNMTGLYADNAAKELLFVLDNDFKIREVNLNGRPIYAWQTDRLRAAKAGLAESNVF